MRRRTAVVVMAGALAAACGGGSGPTGSSTTPVSTGDPSKVVQLDAASFDPTVLASSVPSLVEFHSPT
jgi:hypothetical protein